MSNVAHAELRTTTLIVGPLVKPLGPELGAQVGRFMARAISHGYAVAKFEDAETVTVTAVQSAPITTPSTRARAVTASASQE